MRVLIVLFRVVNAKIFFCLVLGPRNFENQNSKTHFLAVLGNSVGQKAPLKTPPPSGSVKKDGPGKQVKKIVPGLVPKPGKSPVKGNHLVILF